MEVEEAMEEATVLDREEVMRLRVQQRRGGGEEGARMHYDPYGILEHQTSKLALT